MNELILKCLKSTLEETGNDCVDGEEGELVRGQLMYRTLKVWRSAAHCAGRAKETPDAGWRRALPSFGAHCDAFSPRFTLLRLFLLHFHSSSHLVRHWRRFFCLFEVVVGLGLGLFVDFVT